MRLDHQLNLFCFLFSQREAQASVVQYIVKSMEGQYDELIILGDCNDYSATTLDAAGLY